MPRQTYVRGHYRRTHRARGGGSVFGLLLFVIAAFGICGIIANHPDAFGGVLIIVAALVAVVLFIRHDARKKRRAAFLAEQEALFLQRQGRDSRYIPQWIRQQVWTRCGGCCVECGSTFYLEYDHIIPLARGGATSAENLQLLCRSCNMRKGQSI
jgi:hypothetical protein